MSNIPDKPRGDDYAKQRINEVVDDVLSDLQAVLILMTGWAEDREGGGIRVSEDDRILFLGVLNRGTEGLNSVSGLVRSGNVVQAWGEAETLQGEIRKRIAGVTREAVR